MEIIDEDCVEGPCQYSSLPTLPGMLQHSIQRNNDPKAQLMRRGFLQY